MMENLLEQITNNITIDFMLKLAQIASSSVVAITIIFTVISYRKMRKTEQIKLAHDFFTEYKELEGQSAMLYEQDKPQEQRMDWASRYFNTLEWFSYLVNTKEITNPRLLGFYDSIILDSYEKILPKYYNSKQIDEENFFPEFQELYKNLKEGKIKVYHHKSKSI